MTRMIKAFLLIRPHNVAAALLCVASGFWMAAWPARVPLPLLFAVALVTAAGNVINDCCDRDIDRINKPRRVIPSGAMTVSVSDGATNAPAVCETPATVALSVVLPVTVVVPPARAMASLLIVNVPPSTSNASAPPVLSPLVVASHRAPSASSNIELM